MNDAFPDLQQLQFDSPQTTAFLANLGGIKNSSRAPKIRGEFLKGPIPLNWLGKAAKLPGKSLAVALAIMFEVGRRRSNEIKLTTAILDRFNVGRKAKYRALKELEGAKLISVVRTPRRNPLVAVLAVDDHQNDVDFPKG
jgi:hypothetical protein